MSAPLDIEGIARRNPGVNTEALQKSRETNEKLKARGVTKKGYGLSLPYAHKARPVASGEIQYFAEQED